MNTRTYKSDILSLCINIQVIVLLLNEIILCLLHQGFEWLLISYRQILQYYQYFESFGIYEKNDVQIVKLDHRHDLTC